MFQRLDNLFGEISEELLDLDVLMMSPHVYEHGLVKFIKNGGSHDVYTISDYLEIDDRPIKVEGMERLNRTMWNVCKQLAAHFDHDGPVTCHLFISPKGGVSFPMHTDLDDVVIYMVTGQKTFESTDGSMDLVAGDSIYIPRGTKHRAINTDSSLMLSFGLELFTEAKL